MLVKENVLVGIADFFTYTPKFVVINSCVSLA